jgi:hypothetical protein
MKQIKAVIFSVAILILISQIGCATIISGKSQNVTISSRPQGAQVTVNGFIGTTPCTANLKKGESYQIIATKEKYEPTSLSIGTKFNPVFLLNILCGGIIGMGIDLISGAYLDLDRSEVTIILTPKEAKKENEP